MTAGRNAETLNLLDDLAKEAQKRRVTGFVFSHTGGDALSVTVRNGEVEHVGGENPNGVSIEVYLGNRIGFASTNSLNPADLKATLSEAILRPKSESCRCVSHFARSNTPLLRLSRSNSACSYRVRP